MKKGNIKVLSFLLTIMLVLNFVLPTTVFAISQENPEEYISSGATTEESIAEGMKEPKDQEELQQELDALTYEIESLREANVKHIHLPDGTYQAVVYGEPVHRLNENGEWEEIDNSLSVMNGAIETGDSRVKFAKKITGNESIYTLHDGHYKVTVGLSGARKKTEGVITGTSGSEEGMTKLQKLTYVEHISSSVVYEDILEGVDLEYVMISDSIKENLIVKEAADAYSYSFTLELNGLTAELREGDILLCDPSSGETIYCIPAPYMYDAAGNESCDAYYTLTSSNNGKYVFTLTADAQWINAPDRSFPVTIDPSLLDIGQTADAYVTSQRKFDNFGGAQSLYVSSAAEAYYRFETPNLPDGTTITSAYVKVPFYFSSDDGSYATVRIREITSNWYEDTVTWNTRAATSSSYLDTNDLYADGAISTDPEYALFYVTSYVRSWYTGTNNFGFALTYSGGTASIVKFVSREKMQLFAQLTISYTGTHLAEGVYAIQKNGSNCYFKSYIPGLRAWVLQDADSYTAPPVSSSHLENLFKVSYRPDHDDYVIRSMLDSSLVIYPSTGNNAPIASRRTESDSELSTAYTWKIEYYGGYYYITYTSGGTKYYVRSTDMNQDSRLIFTTNSSDTGTGWNFHKYAGNVYEEVVASDFDYRLAVGETYPYQAYMRSTRIGHNGPVSYRVRNVNYETTDLATIDESTGQLSALKVGTFKIGVTYPGAPWIWYWTITIDGYISADLAAMAFATEIYAASLYIRHEYATEIYEVTEDETTLYYYTEPTAGSPHGATIDLSRVPSNGTAVAYAHTHPNSNSFSAADINCANSHQIDAYFNGPNLEVKKYEYSSGQYPISVGTITPTPLTYSQKEALEEEFYDSWHNHIVNGVCPSGFGCENITWPTS